MVGVFEIYIQTHFSAAHALRGYPEDCARGHGHNWIIDVFVRCNKLNEIVIGLDFREIKDSVKGVINGLDHFDLNELLAFCFYGILGLVLEAHRVINPWKLQHRFDCTNQKF